MVSISDLLLPADEDPVSPAKPAPEPAHFTIELIVDTICPFCFIGTTSLNAAIRNYKTRHPDATFEVTVSPFILAPNAARSAYDKTHYYTRYRGLPESRFAHWAQLGRDYGINFSWRGTTGNTRDSHKLLRFCLESAPTTTRSTAFARRQPAVMPLTTLASRADPHLQAQSPVSPVSSEPAPPLVRQQSTFSPGMPPAMPALPATSRQPRSPALQLRLLEALFRGYHEFDRDLSDRHFLTETAMAVTGWSPAEIHAVLDSPDWDRAVDALTAEVQSRLQVRSRQLNLIAAVPTIIVNGRWVYGGWQTVDFLVSQFEYLGAGRAPTPQPGANAMLATGSGPMSSGRGSTGPSTPGSQQR
ncbi:thioredoxin-like protein [Xylariaceae sp. FL0804]|nr:thioredoxin-like protein [Xylariaceae sp. FL0804]